MFNMSEKLVLYLLIMYTSFMMCEIYIIFKHKIILNLNIDYLLKTIYGCNY